jgi:hypothetical protein
MTSALDSHVGLAKQTAKGTAITADASFKYLFFNDGPGMTPAPIVLPLDQEIGAGPLVRDMEKVGISSAGNMNFIPRANTLGLLLLGALGAVSSVTGSTPKEHTFKFAANEFDVPYFTFRRRSSALGGGEVFPDVRVASVGLNFRAANFLRGQAAFLGVGLPEYVDDVAAWTPASYLDTTPPMLTCKGALSIDGESFKALSGSVVMGNVMPMQEQAIVGQYNFDDAEIVSRAIIIQLVVKAQAALYEKMMYDINQGGQWTPGIFKTADIGISFESTQEISAGAPYKVEVFANGQNDNTSNIAWSVAPIALRGNRQVTMAVTGMILADTTSYADGPFSVKLTNTQSAY